MLPGVIFDMDGLLFDTEAIYRESWLILAQQFGQEPSIPFTKAVCGTSGETMIAVVEKFYPAIDPQEFIDACVNRVNSEVKRHLPEMPGVREILAYVKKMGLKVAVASSSEKEIIEHNLEKAGIMPYFDAIVSGGEVEKGKPYPDIFLLAASRLGLKAEECYVFEDGANGIRAGHAAGCHTIMIPDLTPASEELRSFCVAVYDNLLLAKEALKRGEI